MSLLPLELALKPMRDYQASSYKRTREAIALNKWRCTVLYLPTSGGKTQISVHMIAAALEKGKRPLFIVPMLSLLEKTVAAFEEQGITDVGVIQARHHRTNPQARLQIASMQTLISRPELMQGYDLVIVDECHVVYTEFNAWMQRDKRCVFIGLSATPWTKGMGRNWHGMVIGSTISELLTIKAICPFEVYEPAHLPDRRKVKIDGGDFQEAAAAKAMGEKQLVADVYEMWEERGSMSRWFVFAQNCNHAKVLQADFASHGVAVGYIDADSPIDERETLIRDLVANQIHVLFSVGCLGTGVDVPSLRGVTLAYMTRSRIKLTQDLGRLMRNAPGKTMGIVNDHGGNIAALGMPEDYNFDHLDTSDPNEPGDAYKEVREPAKPKRCSQCRMVLPPKTRTCPKCGQLAVTSDVVTVDGELVKREKKEPKEKYTMDQKQAFYSQMIGLLQDRTGRRVDEVRGRAANLYREKFGVWPNRLLEMAAMPQRAVVDFERHSRIKYAKGKEAEKKRAVSHA